jgi:hypothetical protein
MSDKSGFSINLTVYPTRSRVCSFFAVIRGNESFTSKKQQYISQKEVHIRTLIDQSVSNSSQKQLSVKIDWIVLYLFSTFLFSRHAVSTKRGERVYYCVNIALIVIVRSTR